MFGTLDLKDRQDPFLIKKTFTKALALNPKTFGARVKTSSSRKASIKKSK